MDGKIDTALQGEPWPEEIRLSPDKSVLFIRFDDGNAFELAAEYLRVESPSAEVQGHSPAEKKTVSGKQSVRIVALDPVGHYALKLRFDDGHDTGLFTWRYFYELGAKHAAKWADYLSRLEAEGLRR
jgi:DUF971 family protein